MAECGEYVGGGTITFPCSLDKDHKGPHYASEVPRSATQRRRWVQEAEEAKQVLAAHGGRPLTFAENIGEGPGSPVPGSNLQPAEYRAAEPASASPPGNKPAADQTQVASWTPSGEVEVWNGQGDPGPYACLICGSVGSGLGMPGHIQEEHPDGLPDEHEQALPVVNERPSIQGLLIADIEERTKIGIQRYGTPLQAFNGRNSVRDAYEEAVDLATYLRQVKEEKAELAQRLRTLMDTEGGFMYVPGDEGIIADILNWLEG